MSFHFQFLSALELPHFFSLFLWYRYDGGLCYPKCRAGFYGVGPICWSMTQTTKGRGVGKIPQNCPRHRPEKDAGLCYKKCRSTYTGTGPLCTRKWVGERGKNFGHRHANVKNKEKKAVLKPSGMSVEIDFGFKHRCLTQPANVSNASAACGSGMATLPSWNHVLRTRARFEVVLVLVGEKWFRIGNSHLKAFRALQQKNQIG